jgi:hypothetical protein
VIRSFKDKQTERLFNSERVAAFRAVASIAIRKLDMLDAASSFSICGRRREIVSKRCAVTAVASTAFGSTTNGASALSGATAALNRSKSWTIIEGVEDGAYPHPPR